MKINAISLALLSSFSLAFASEEPANSFKLPPHTPVISQSPNSFTGYVCSLLLHVLPPVPNEWPHYSLSFGSAGSGGNFERYKRDVALLISNGRYSDPRQVASNPQMTQATHQILQQRYEERVREGDDVSRETFFKNLTPHVQNAEQKLQEEKKEK